MSSALDYSVLREGQKAIVQLRGEIDMDSAPALLKIFESEIGSGRNLRVDLAAVLYCDSSGIATLVHGLQLARKRGLEFHLGGLSQAVASVLELASLSDFFPRDEGGAV